MLRSSGLNVGGAYLDMISLPATGTFSIVVDPNGTYTGSTSITLYDVPADRLTNVTTPIVNVIVKNPDGTTLMPAVGVGVGGKWIEPLTLPQTGTYTLKLDPQTFSKGSETVTAWTFDGDATANVLADGAGHTLNLATPGQNGSLYLDGSNGDRVSFTGVSVPSGKMWIKNPDGTILVPSQAFGPSGIMVEPLTLGANGSYHVFLNPDIYHTGSVTVRAYTVPPDIVDDVAADATPDSVPFTIPGQNAKLRFDATAGEVVSLKLASSVADTEFQILKPNGNVLYSGSVGTSGAFVDPITLPVDGKYKVVLDPHGFSLGTITGTLYDVPGDAIVAGALNSTSTVAVGTPGQNGAVTFAGTAGQRVSLTASGVTISSSPSVAPTPSRSTRRGRASAPTGSR